MNNFIHWIDSDTNYANGDNEKPTTAEKHVRDSLANHVFTYKAGRIPIGATNSDPWDLRYVRNLRPPFLWF